MCIFTVSVSTGNGTVGCQFSLRRSGGSGARGDTTADTLVNVNVEIIGKNTRFVRAYNEYMRTVAKAIDACF